MRTKPCGQIYLYGEILSIFDRFTILNDKADASYMKCPLSLVIPWFSRRTQTGCMDEQRPAGRPYNVYRVT